MYLNGIMLYIEGKERHSGDVYENDVTVSWNIDKVEFVDRTDEAKINKNELKEIMEEAFTAFSYYGMLTKESVKEVIVNINAEL